MKNIFKISFLAIAISFASCKNDDADVPSVITETAIDIAKTDFVATYVSIVEASYADALAQTKVLETAISTFASDKTAANFDAAKQAWLDAREPYGQTEAYRFYDGPIDGADGEPEGYINAWPLDEALIDYVADGTGGQDTSDVRQNIINNTDEYPELTEDVIRGIAGFDDNESNVSIGYHAIEFLLWGQDSTAPSEKTAGLRTYEDYTSADNADRRLAYLQTVASLLVDDLQTVVDLWENSYKAEFLALTSDAAITNILTGAAKLSKGELAGERMFVAVENQDQEDEHSCFSDNTHRDVFLNAKSINNIITGTYTKVDGTVVSGTSLLAVLALVNTDEATSLTATAATVMTKVTVISEAQFFDFQIIGETIDDTTKPVMSAITSLRTQGDELAQAGSTITGATIDPSV